jgi:hypothetical protein
MYSFAKKNLWDVSQNNLYQQFVMQIVADPIEFHVTGIYIVKRRQTLSCGTSH